MTGDNRAFSSRLAKGEDTAEAAPRPEDSPEAKRYFRKRTLLIILVAVGFFVVCGICGAYVDFDFVGSLVDIPSAFVWMATNFMPSVAALEKMPEIIEALFSTILASISASVIAAFFAYITAVIGSRSVGLGAAASVIVRGIASVFRNIPVVAWAFILLFSFHQSEFTGFLALFFGSYGYLTRCFLESIDEVSGGAVEALRATGANYPQIIMQAVLPLSITSVVSWMLYMVETNIRDATLVGILTGTGIGFVFTVYYNRFYYDQAALVVLMIVIVVIACEATSNYVRRRII